MDASEDQRQSYIKDRLEEDFLRRPPEKAEEPFDLNKSNEYENSIKSLDSPCRDLQLEERVLRPDILFLSSRIALKRVQDSRY